MYFRLCLVVVLLFIVNAQTKPCGLPNGEEGIICIPLSSCPAISQGFLNPLVKRTETEFRKLVCDRGPPLDPKVCCTVSQNSISHLHELSDRRYCGYQHRDDYISSRNITSIDEFPWLAAIRAYDEFHKEEIVRCLGSLINARYVLTAAQCFSIYPVIGIRLGEFSIRNETDCIEISHYDTEECSDIQNFALERVIKHPLYEFAPIHDIALVRLNRTVQYSDYVRPICLPTPGSTFSSPGDSLYTTGWGFLSKQGNIADIKKKVRTVLITGDECQKQMASLGAQIPSTIFGMCTVDATNNTEFACVGDGGAPIMFSVRNQWQLEGIARGVVGCGVGTPIIEVRVSRYLEIWNGFISTFSHSFQYLKVQRQKNRALILCKDNFYITAHS